MNYIEEAIKSIAKAEGLMNYSTETVNGPVKGEGHLGTMKALKIVGITNKNVSKTINCIVKSAPKSEALRNELPVRSAYEFEIRAYSTIFPALQKFEISKNQIPAEFTPKFYYAISVEKEETLIMENLNDSGYRLHPNDCSMNDEHLRLLLKQFARFHATSLALRDQKYDKFQQLTEKFSDINIPFLRDSMTKSVNNGFDKALAALDVLQDSHAIKAFKSFTSNINTFYEDLMGTSSDEHCVILHGDCWNNNFMFKYGDLSHPTKPTSVKLLDFQAQRLGLPVVDLSYFFYSSPSMNVIEKCNEYLDFYYETFSDYLGKLGSDSQKLYPYELFMEHWKKYARFSLIVTPIIVLEGLKDPSDSVDFETVAERGADVSSTFVYEISNMDSFNEKLRHLILHFVNNDWL